MTSHARSWPGQSYLIATVTALALLGASADAHAQRRSRPACGLKDLPLVEGHSWTYEPFEPPKQEGQDEQKKSIHIPDPAQKVVVEVIGVDKTDDGVTEVTLRETVDDADRETVLRCTPKWIDVSPQSFLFTGEPGGGRLLELKELERTGHSYQVRGGILRGQPWTEELEAVVERSATEGTEAELSDGTIELRRQVSIGGKERISSASGGYTATRVSYELSGRARVDDKPDKPHEIPAGAVGALWFARGVGVVQIYNIQGHFYQLVDSDLGDDE